MKLFYGEDDLCNVDACLVFVKSLFELEIFGQVSSGAELKEEEEFVLGLECKIEADYERVVDV